ncbi:1-acyl-sn-glycerol-3-phosphate acyltransferase [Candidatus Jorgensenbacteria bacterium]|nr:1-acyl-sn-glycerol-3-phosphate acyltransferase [Candidatus Jorgensenbacteria bacterium]
MTNRGILIASNHPSLLEPLLIPVLYFRRYLLNPFRYVPWGTPDWGNFIKPWYLWWFRCLHTIPIYRGEAASIKKTREALNEIIEKLNHRNIVVLFPEGGRTFKRVESKEGEATPRLGSLKKGFDIVVRNSDCTIMPLWVEGADKVLPPGQWLPRFSKGVITFVIGEKIDAKITRHELSKKLIELSEKIKTAPT